MRSLKNPVRWKFDFGIRQRGHGQRPLSRMVARRTLQIDQLSGQQVHTIHSLFRIVGRVCKYPGVYSPGDPVEAFHDYTILVSLYEIVIE